MRNLIDDVGVGLHCLVFILCCHGNESLVNMKKT